MPDDSLRSTQGNSPEQRDDAPPAWWDDLGRIDLPDDSGRPMGGWIKVEDLAPRAEPQLMVRSWPVWATNLIVLLVTTISGLLLMRMVMPASSLVTVALVTVPVLLVSVSAAAIIQRRDR